MALVLREKKDRSGATTRFDVVRAESGSPDQVLDGIPEGEYRVLEGDKVDTYNVSYRVVQDLVKV